MDKPALSDELGVLLASRSLRKGQAKIERSIVLKEQWAIHRGRETRSMVI